jgi:hypothetical protein
MIANRRFISPRPLTATSAFQAKLLLLPERFAFDFNADRYFAVIAAE